MQSVGDLFSDRFFGPSDLSEGDFQRGEFATVSETRIRKAVQVAIEAPSTHLHSECTSGAILEVVPFI